MPLTSTLGNEYPSSNETSKKNGTVRGDCIACDALFLNENICCDPSLESSQRDCSNDASQNMFYYVEIWMIIPVTPSYLEH